MFGDNTKWAAGALGVALAVFFSSHMILALGYGLIGSTGNHLVTACVLVGSALAIFLLSYRRIVPGWADLFFAIFIVSVGLSFLSNPYVASKQETMLLAFSLSAYVAFRGLTAEMTARAMVSFSLVTLVVVLMGVFFTTVALIEIWSSDQYLKPFVLGFDAESIYLLVSVSSLIFVFVSRPLTFRNVSVGSLLLLPVIFGLAASTVRFACVALLVSLCVTAFVNRKPQRLFIFLISFVVLFAVGAGWSARPEASKAILSQTLAVLGAEKPAAGPLSQAPIDQKTKNSVKRLPSCYTKIDLRNSLDIRVGLLKDALSLLPTAGLVGYGLDRFMGLSCIENTQIHNSFLQALVEFGWIGGLSLIALSGFLLLRMMQLASLSDSVKFVFSLLVFVFMLRIAYGRVSQDAVFFATLGWSAALLDARTSRSESQV